MIQNMAASGSVLSKTVTLASNMLDVPQSEVAHASRVDLRMG
jgi:hypothetical protein